MLELIDVVIRVRIRNIFYTFSEVSHHRCCLRWQMVTNKIWTFLVFRFNLLYIWGMSDSLGKCFTLKNISAWCRFLNWYGIQNVTFWTLLVKNGFCVSIDYFAFLYALLNPLFYIPFRQLMLIVFWQHAFSWLYSWWINVLRRS